MSSDDDRSMIANAAEFIVGAIVLIMALLGDPIRPGLVILALILMGVITIDQLRDLLEHRTTARRSPSDAADESSAPEVPPRP